MTGWLSGAGRVWRSPSGLAGDPDPQERGAPTAVHSLLDVGPGLPQPGRAGEPSPGGLHQVDAPPAELAPGASASGPRAEAVALAVTRQLPVPAVSRHREGGNGSRRGRSSRARRRARWSRPHRSAPRGPSGLISPRAREGSRHGPNVCGPPVGRSRGTLRSGSRHGDQGSRRTVRGEGGRRDVRLGPGPSRTTTDIDLVILASMDILSDGRRS